MDQDETEGAAEARAGEGQEVMGSPAKKLGSEDAVFARLCESKRKAGSVIFPQVRESVGLAVFRAADAIAMSIWPSRGIYFEGFEIKVARGDWLKELREESKAAAFTGACRYWWLVLGGPGIAEPHEVPGAWGIIEWTGKRLTTRRQAQDLGSLADIPIDFVAAVLRRLGEGMVPAKSVKATVEQAYEDGRASVPADSNKELEVARRNFAELRALHTTLEAAFGTPINKWSTDGIVESYGLGEALRQLDAKGQVRDLLAMQQRIGELIESYRKIGNGIT